MFKVGPRYSQTQRHFVPASAPNPFDSLQSLISHPAFRVVLTNLSFIANNNEKHTVLIGSVGA